MSLQHLSFEEVIQRAAVSRSAAYRLWPYKENFYEDLLVALAQADEPTIEEDAFAAGAEYLARHMEQLATAEGRALLLQQLCRIGAETHFRNMISTPHWRTQVTVTTTLISMPPGPARDRLAAAIADRELQFVQRMAGAYQLMAEVIGYRLRPEYNGNYQVLVALASAVAEGLGLQRIATPTLMQDEHWSPSNGDETGTSWTLPAIGFSAIVDRLFEPDPNWQPPTS